jgi:hypothetical protein
VIWVRVYAMAWSQSMSVPRAWSSRARSSPRASVTIELISRAIGGDSTTEASFDAGGRRSDWMKIDLA